MKFSAQEEYGLRFLLRIGKYYGEKDGFTIPEISEAEGISQHTVAKILRLLRLGEFLESSRGQIGGYALKKPPEEINIGEVMTALGGKLFDDGFCRTHAGEKNICLNSIDCSIRSLWRMIQDSVDQVVNNLTLKDLLVSEDLLINFFNGNTNAQ
ncbi:MAG: Rrf2 family transcriptional regulator [Ignavibacteria bacterium RBG_13_36_8]|nr:MAG: Rrf2 family transcriptional regulator [Ignavibacteria bacterium RBG_13_36_8]